MKAIHYREYRVEDMLEILAETEPAEDHDDIWQRHVETAETRLHGLSYSFFCGDELIACAGITYYWPGLGEVWLAHAKCWTNYKREAVIWTRKVLDCLQKDTKRIEAWVVAEDAMARRYVEHYGFQAEGTARARDVLGRDLVLYGRVKQ